MLNISLKAEEIFRIGGFPVTNSLILSAIVLALLAIIAFRVRRDLTMVPGRLQNTIEMILKGVLGVMDTVLGDRRASEKYLPLVATIFFLVIFSNWLGLLPGVGSVGIAHDHEITPFLRSPASDLNFTLALALIAVTFVNIFGTAAVGLKSRLKVFFNFDGPIALFISILEFVSEFAKIISFSFRLFGNVFAGEVLLAIISFLVPYIIPLPFMFLEIFVGFVQAFIFAMLVLVFISSAISHGEAEHKSGPYAEIAPEFVN